MAELNPKAEEAPVRSRRRRRAWILLLIFLLGILLALTIGAWLWWQLDVEDPFPAYSLSLDFGAPDPGDVRAGAAKVDITPVIRETWTDTDGDASFEPDAGDSFDDVDGDGEFDAVWIAGFDNGRAANGVHDPLWARAIVIEVARPERKNSEAVRIGLVSVDLIGLFHTSVIRVRNALGDARAGRRPLVDYLLIASTHVHSGPDTLGLWGPDDYRTGVDPNYISRVEGAIVESLEKAVESLRPARLRFRSEHFGSGKWMHDWRRRPMVVDDVLGVIDFRDRSNDATIATWVRWASHPESLGDDVTLISSDYPHWLREQVERDNGGICVFANGAIGGMMTSLSIDLPHPETGALIPARAKDSPELPWLRAQAVGEGVGKEVLRLLSESRPDDGREASSVHVRAKTFFVSIENPLFRLAGKLGRIERGSFEKRLRTEAAIIDLGPARLVCVPGEMYPEIVYGGIETPEGADFPGPPVEVPPLAEALAGPGVEHLLVVGLANDELGYFIPKTEWDAPAGLPWDEDGNPPYLYGADKPPYGEINSCGPNAASQVHRALLSLAE